MKSARSMMAKFVLGKHYRGAPIQRKSTPLSRWIAQELINQGFLHNGMHADEFCIRRTYAGRNQRSAGAWLWTLELVSGVWDHVNRSIPANIGSQWPASELKETGFDAGYTHGRSDLDLTPQVVRK